MTGTLVEVIPALEALIGNRLERILVDAGYRGHTAPPDYRFRIYTAGLELRVTAKIKREI
jgi:transposase, IS5 family